MPMQMHFQLRGQSEGFICMTLFQHGDKADAALGRGFYPLVHVCHCKCTCNSVVGVRVLCVWIPPLSISLPTFYCFDTRVSGASNHRNCHFICCLYIQHTHSEHYQT